MFSTPLLFIVFNRPALTSVVLERIREIRPTKLYVAADGPRKDRPDDIVNCAAVRKIASAIDWPCEVKTRFHDHNLGCKYAVSTAVTWFFAAEEAGIILEDDILPDLSFFDFCSAMLDRYRSHEAVMHVAGFNICGRWRDQEQAYHFSRFGGIWGWASWRRAWRHYDVEIRDWAQPAVQRRILETHFPRELQAARKKLYDDLHAGRIDTWDYQWTLCRLLHDGQSIVPARNLVRNIGFGADATHTRSSPRWVADESYSLGEPIKPKEHSIDRAYDQIHLLLSTHNVSFSEYQKLIASRRRTAA